MVRATTGDASDGKKDSTAKKHLTSSKKKNAASRVWPCTINGCDKQFAREADLKRHQRTTKLHSQPSFLCPQCEATFTRTDALRRHQKSRHKGVVIEPSTDSGKKEEDGDEDAHMSGSPASRDATPSGKSEDRTTPMQASGATATTSAATSSVTVGRYREHNIPFVFPQPAYPPPPEGATRLHPIRSWENPWTTTPAPALPHAYPSVPPGSSHPSLHYPQTPGAEPRHSGSVSPRSTTSSSSFSTISDTNRSVDSTTADDDVATSNAEVFKSEAFQQALAKLNGPEDTTTDGDSSTANLSNAINPSSIYSTASTSVRHSLPPIETMDLVHGSPVPRTVVQPSPTTILSRQSPIPSSSHSSRDQDEGGRPDPLQPSLNDPYASKPLKRPESMGQLVMDNGDVMLHPAEILRFDDTPSPSNSNS